MIIVYDLRRNFCNFDIVTLLMSGDHRRIQVGEPELSIEIHPGPRLDHRTLSSVLLPMCAMLPSNRGTTTAEPTQHRNFSPFGQGLFMQFGYFVDAYAAGIRPLRPPAEPERRTDLITITLRESSKWPTRNSDPEQWRGAALMLKLMGYRVIAVRDTERAEEPLGEIETAPLASRDLVARAALYRSAACNLFVSNGPAWFALALDAPTVIFRPTCETAGHLARAGSMARVGIVVGQQLPGAPAHQRLAWEQDTAENIVSAAVRMVG